MALSMLSDGRAELPWPEVVQRLAHENEKLAQRPGGHAGEYFVVCTLYYTPVESGFTSARGFDATPVTKPQVSGAALRCILLLGTLVGAAMGLTMGTSSRPTGSR